MTGKKWRRESQKPRERKRPKRPQGDGRLLCHFFFFNFSFFLFLRLFLSCIDYPTTNDSGCYCINRVQNGRCDFLSSFCRQSESRETVSFFSLVLVVEIDLLLQQNNNKKRVVKERPFSPPRIWCRSAVQVNIEFTQRQQQRRVL